MSIDTKIIEDAVKAGLLNTANPTKWFDENAINSYSATLSKFAELTKARNIADAKHPVDSDLVNALRDRIIEIYNVDASELNQLLALVSSQIPTNSNDAVDAKRWKRFADNQQTALMLGSKLDPNNQGIDWLTECNMLVDAATKEGK